MTTDAEARADRLTENPEVEWLNLKEVVTAAADVHEGAMIALVPAGDDLNRLTLDGGEPEDQLHLTLVYLGDAVDLNDQQRQDILDQVEAGSLVQPVVEAEAFGVSLFNPQGDEPCVVLICGGMSLDDVHEAALTAVDEIDVPYPDPKLPWIPHITLAYSDDEMQLARSFMAARDRVGIVQFDRIRVAFGGDVTDFPLNDAMLAASDLAFHMAGQHNQSTHGRGGATPSELDAGRRLNAGKQLNMDDPEQARISQAIGVWATGGNDGGALAIEMQDAVNDPGADTMGASFMRTIAGAPADSPTLYRGMAHVAPDDVPKAGDVFELGPTSFTRSTKIRDVFSAHESGPSSFGHETQMHVTVKSGSRALKIDHASSMPAEYKGEQEHVGMGKYRVTKYKEHEVTIKSRTGVKKTVTRYEVDVEQVPDTMETTIKTNKAPVQTDEWWGN